MPRNEIVPEAPPHFIIRLVLEGIHFWPSRVMVNNREGILGPSLRLWQWSNEVHGPNLSRRLSDRHIPHGRTLRACYMNLAQGAVLVVPVDI